MLSDCIALAAAIWDGEPAEEQLHDALQAEGFTKLALHFLSHGHFKGRHMCDLARRMSNPKLNDCGVYGPEFTRLHIRSAT